jgi:myo-inositol-1(or 4)-monophosphatase
MTVAIAAAKSAGIVIKSLYLQQYQVTNKLVGSQSHGFVTAADLEAERVIVETIRQSFPNDGVLAEEEHSDDVDAEHLWIIDPLDGTNNFAHHIPHCAVSIGYYRNGNAQCGVIHNPLNGEWYIAERGQGAWFGDRVARVDDRKSLEQSLIGFGFYYERDRLMRATLDAIGQLFASGVQGVRRMGTASLDLVNVGMGRFGGYFEFTLSPWDFAAGRLFVEEAGGRVTDCLGHPLPVGKSSVLASNGQLHEQLLAIVGKSYLD